LNVRGISNKIHELNNHITKDNVAIICMVETFLKTDNKTPKPNKNYSWVGKCRKHSKGKIILQEFMHKIISKAGGLAL
jgi:hypothetical protein